MKKNLILLCVTAALLLSCNNKKNNTAATDKNDTIAIEKPLTKADSIVNRAIEAHGGKLYNDADYSFEFRGKKYRFQNGEAAYTYSSEIQKGDSLIKDVMTSDKFERTINSELQSLSAADAGKYGESLNSVIYFATLPHKLQDASVNKKYVEETTIKGKKYDVIEVTFGQDGGGKDFDDQYQYWINKETHLMDYFAYNYQVNDGGVRFRAAFNTRVVADVTFQDYINYEAPVKTPLKDLPALYEQGKLKEASKILTENIVSNRK
ncbi:hypothetical protein SAMN05443667_102200 [Flavobacterium gillisiae]|uniref:Deoxyribose-phosphate aldolase n=1 Tax=Flavobacterium gillisiae TaxID=150146 RepID=A0A1H3Z1E0_9FLAO|nr:DUF6503 family protein [Flavobacterium gillisiae]SEA17132.1 hypothetical protein SAMN05443667_102200 [Flavobacterium gillisiae]